MWWFCVLLFVAVSGRPGETHRSLVSSVAADSALSFSRDNWPGELNPHYNSNPINGNECMQPGDMFYIVNGEVYNVCTCVLNEKGSLVRKCSPCNRCSRRLMSSILTSVPSPLKPIPSSTVPVSSPPLPIPSPAGPIPSPAGPIPSPAGPIPSPFKPVYPPVPVPSSTIPSPFNPVPSPSEPVPSPFNPIPVPTPPLPVLSPAGLIPSPSLPVYPPLPVPSPPVPSPFNRVLSTPEPVPSPPNPVPSIPRTVASIPDIPVYILGSDGLVIAPVPGSTENCRQREPFVPFREPNVPCKLFVCKVKYNLVYVESFPDPLCSGNNEFVDSRSSDALTEATSNVKLWSLEEFLEWVRSHPSAQVAHIANDGLSSHGGLDELGNIQSIAQADATANTVLSGYEGFGGLVNRQSSAQTEVLANTGLSGYGDLSGLSKNPSGEANAAANVSLAGFKNFGEWDYRQGPALSNVIFKKYGDKIELRNSDSTAQTDTTVFAGQDTSRSTGGWVKSEGPAFARYSNYRTDNNGHDGERRSASLDDQDVSERENLNERNRLGCGSSPLHLCLGGRSASTMATDIRLDEGTNSQLEKHGQAIIAQPHVENVLLSRYETPGNLYSSELNVLGGLLSSWQAGLQALDIKKHFGADLLTNDKTP